MKMSNKYKNSQIQKGHGSENVVWCFNSKIACIFGMLILMTVALQNHICRVQAKTLHHDTKKNLKLLQSPSSLIQLRHRRETFEHEGDQTSSNSDYYDDDNYDVLPGGGGDAGDSYPSPPTMDDQISEKAQQVAESFKNMWQSLTDSIRHCIDALRAMFGEETDAGELTPEQEQQILIEMEERYRLNQEHDNEVIMNVYGNKL